MVDWLVATKHPSSIVLAADSMGAAASLAEAVEDPRIDGLILDSMHANLVVASGNILEAEHGHPSLPGSWAIVALTSLRVGGDVTSVDPVAMITRLGDRPVLLTHGTGDQVDRPAESAERDLHAAMAAGVPIELHYCQGSTHGKTLESLSSRVGALGDVVPGGRRRIVTRQPRATVASAWMITAAAASGASSEVSTSTS